VQTKKVGKRVPVVLYGREFWDEVLNLDALVRWGTISPADVELIRICSTPVEAFEYLRDELTRLHLHPVAERGAD
jgi:predicted Rossmann-fold nucleotide-binding protein